MLMKYPAHPSPRLRQPRHGRGGAGALALALLLTALGCTPTAETQVPGGAESVRPGINDSYMKARDSDMEGWTESLEGESREVVSSRDAIVALMGLSNGQVVADVGSGTGLFSSALSDAVGEAGTVVAVDIAPTFLEHVRARMTSEGKTNFIYHLAGSTDVGLPAEVKLDVAFMCNVYHHVEYPGLYMPSLGRAMRPGAVLWLVDFRRVEGVTDPGILRHVRAGRETVIEEVTSAGFELVDEPELLEENYILKFVWPGG